MILCTSISVARWPHWIILNPLVWLKSIRQGQRRPWKAIKVYFLESLSSCCDIEQLWWISGLRLGRCRIPPSTWLWNTQKKSWRNMCWWMELQVVQGHLSFVVSPLVQLLIVTESIFVFTGLTGLTGLTGGSWKVQRVGLRGQRSSMRSVPCRTAVVLLAVSGKSSASPVLKQVPGDKDVEDEGDEGVDRKELHKHPFRRCWVSHAFFKLIWGQLGRILVWSRWWRVWGPAQLLVMPKTASDSWFRWLLLLII